MISVFFSCLLIGLYVCTTLSGDTGSQKSSCKCSPFGKTPCMILTESFKTGVSYLIPLTFLTLISFSVAETILRCLSYIITSSSLIVMILELVAL